MRPGRIGVLLGPADDPAALVHDLPQLALVAVDFPHATDGRGYSTARLLRERYGYTGELRAVGDVGRDQLFYLARVGFDAFALREGEDVAGALGGVRGLQRSLPGLGRATPAAVPAAHHRRALCGRRSERAFAPAGAPKGVQLSAGRLDRLIFVAASRTLRRMRASERAVWLA